LRIYSKENIVILLCNISDHFLIIVLVSFLGAKTQSYLALISAHVNNVEIIMTCFSLDRFQLYRDLDQFYEKWTPPIGNFGSIQ